MKSFYLLALLASAGLAACTFNKQTKPVEVPFAGLPGRAAFDAAAREESVQDKELDAKLAALEEEIKSPSFQSRPAEDQYVSLASAGVLAISRDHLKLGYSYLVRAVAMPQVEFEIRATQTYTATRLGLKDDAASGLTAIAKRWPDQLSTLEMGLIVEVLREASQIEHSARLTLLESLYAAHWKLKWGIEPSADWRDLAMLLLETGRAPEATEVANHVTDVYVLVAMRSDRRFDGLIAANPSHFDIDAAAERELRDLQAAADDTPRSLELQTRVIDALIARQHYEAALAASDSIVDAVKSTNFLDRLFQDFEDEYSDFLTSRAIALDRVGRRDEAVAQLTAASRGGNVNQLIALGGLYCDMGLPRGALAAISTVNRRTSHYGTMREEAIRVDAAEQLGDQQEVKRALHYLHAHREDAASVYEDSLIAANQLDAAAQELISQLMDTVHRQDAVQSVQDYAQPAETAREMEVAARWSKVVARRDVQAAIHQVGRIDSYRLEAP